MRKLEDGCESCRRSKVYCDCTHWITAERCCPACSHTIVRAASTTA